MQPHAVCAPQRHPLGEQSLTKGRVLKNGVKATSLSILINRLAQLL